MRPPYSGEPYLTDGLLENIDLHIESKKCQYIFVIMNIGTRFSGQPMYGQLIDLLRRRYSIRDVAKLSGKGVSTIQRVKRLLKVQSPQ